MRLRVARILTFGVQLAIVVCSRAAVAEQSGAPRNDLPQPYRTTRDWGELPTGVKWAAVTAVEPAPDGTIYVVHRKQNLRPEPGTLGEP